MLYSVEGCPANRRRWCGPSAIAGITGNDYPTAMNAIKAVRGRSDFPERLIIKGVPEYEMRGAFERLGYRMNRITFAPGITFARFLRERTPEQRKSIILVVAGNHYMAVSGNKAVDGIVREPVFISKMPGRRKRMESAYIVTRVQKVTPRVMARSVNTVEAQRKIIQKAKLVEAGRNYRRAKAICAEIGLTIEVRGHNEFEVMARNGYLIDDISGRLFSGPDRWAESLEWLEYLHKNGVEQQVNPDDVAED